MTTREKILAQMESHHYHPMKLRRLARFFDVAEEDYAEFRALVKRMISDGDIGVSIQGRLQLPPPEEKPRARPHGRTVLGRFSQSQRGFGFVEPEAKDGPTAGEDVFIPPEENLGAVTNDRVVAEVAGKSPRGYYGRIVEIRERGQTHFVGTYYVAEAGPLVRPDGGILQQDFAVPDASSAGAKPKDKVVFEVVKYGLRGEPGEAVITEVLGERGAPGVDTLVVIRQFELADKFPPEVLAGARAAAERMNDASLEGRRDLTRETVITIDPFDARDFDDAISLTEHDDGTVTLGVHIADVSHFVPEGSALDAEARERGTSVYLPTKVLPMLPEVLSNGVCSLQEGRTRLTKSALMRLDAEGEPVEVELANSFIKSAKRLTYEEASAALEDKTGGLPPKVAELLGKMNRLAKKLLARRRRQGYLELDLPEVDLEFDDNGRVVAVHPEDTSFSHRIIEMFMVEANEAVARELDKAGMPYIRRIHPEPDDEAAEDLMHFAHSVGYALHNPRSRHELQSLLNAVRGKPEAYGIHLAVLRSLKRAEYSVKKEAHFALGSGAYCHFTSPIRRYPDLTVHRAFDLAVRDGGRKRKGGRHKPALAEAADPATKSLVEIAAHSSETERRAEAAERELTKIKLLEYLQTRVGDTFTGVITGVQQFGLFVESPELLIDGLVHISSLKDDTYRFDKRRWALIGSRTGRVLRVGSTLEVQIAAVNIRLRQLDLAPVVTPRAGRPVESEVVARRQHKAERAARKAAKAEKWAKRQQKPGAKSNRKHQR
jgi:ribonuclease R